MSIVLLLSRQRSGTGALASVLERHPDIFYAGEILDPTSQVRPFSGWLVSRGLDTPSIIDTSARFLEFIEELMVESRVNIVDIKYNCLRSIAPNFSNLFDTPWLLQIFSMLPAPMIHLRRSPLESYVSAKIAEREKTFHTTERFMFKGAINIDMSDFADFFYMSQKENRFFQNFLKVTSSTLRMITKIALRMTAIFLVT